MLILVMVVSMIVNSGMQVYAAEEKTTENGIVDFGKGEAVIHIQGNVGQTLKGKTFALYQLFDAENSDNQESIHYSINSMYESALKRVVAERLEKNAEEVTEYEVIDYLQSLNSYSVEGAQAAQEKESTYSEYRYFMEDLMSEFKQEQVSAQTIYVEDVTEDNAVEIRGLAFGYYLVEDVSAIEGEHSAISLSMLGTANPESTMHIKADYPVVVKKIQEDDNQENIGENGWNDIADFEIGQDVPYKYETTIPDMNGYHSYYLAWHDVMDEALSLQEDSIQISISGQVENSSKVYQLTSSEFILNKNTSDATFVIEVANIKSIIDREFPNLNERNENTYGQTIVVSYKATLNDNAAKNTGRPGFENDVRLEYSCNPKLGEEEATAFTPWDTVVCFTYQLNGVKINNHQEVLKGAKFKLYSDEQCNEEVYVKKVGDAYHVVNLDVLNENTSAESISIESNAEGKFDVYGLDSGVYYLKEVDAPNGYRRLLDPIVITINPEFTTERNEYVKGDGAGEDVLKLAASVYMKSFFGGEYHEDDTELEVNQDAGSLYLSVVNEVGSKLPITGSSGMLILGAAGTILMGIAWRRGQKKYE